MVEQRKIPDVATKFKDVKWTIPHETSLMPQERKIPGVTTKLSVM